MSISGAAGFIFYAKTRGEVWIFSSLAEKAPLQVYILSVPLRQ